MLDWIWRSAISFYATTRPGQSPGPRDTTLAGVQRGRVQFGKLWSHGADEGGQVVEAVTLVASDGVAGAVVRPGSDKQYLPAGAGIEHLPAWFPHGREAIFEQSNERKASLLNHVHHGFLTGTDAGRDEHGAALRHHQETLCSVFDFIFGHLAGAFHYDFVGAVEQESIAHDGDALVADDVLLLRPEEFRVVAFGPQATRVVLQVLEHGIELPLTLQDAVVVAFFPEG